MTDNYGSDPNQEQDQQASNPSDDQWQEGGDQPPVDDFADEGAVAEESASVSEESGAAESAGTEIPAKKSSMMLPIAAGVGVLLILGAVLYWQFGGSSTASSPLPPSNPINVASTVPSTPPASPPPAPTPTVPDVAPTTAMTPPPVDTTAPTAALPSNVPTPVAAPVPAPVALPAPVTPGYPSPQAIPSIPPSTDTGSIDQRVIVLAARVDEMQKSLDAANQQLSQLNNILAANPSAAGAGAAPTNAAVEERLSKLEQHLLQAQNNSSGSAPSINPLPSVPSASSSSDEGYKSVSVSHRPKHSVKKKSSSRHASRSSRSSKKSAARETWILRAATPDEAWVAKSESSKDLRRVAVGDQLPGIGRIQAIHQNGDSWVIEGSKGTVR